MSIRIIFILLLISFYSPVFAQVSWNSYFDNCNVKGSTTIFDYRQNKWLSNDMRDSNQPTLPASTFKIINTLIALETGIIQSVEDTIKWPGSIDTIKYGYRPDIFKDITIQEAFNKSAGWAYVEMAKNIGKEKYLRYLDTSNYGNLDLSIDDHDFWNFGDFAISPVNQIEILIAIHEETLPFSKHHFATLKNIMIVEQTDQYTLRAKTGWARYNGQDTGWWVGYIEKTENIYFFATRLIKDRNISNPGFGECRMEITYNILRNLGIID